MAQARNYIRPLLSVILLTGTVLGLINVYGDNADVQQTAATIACGGKQCPTRLTRLERSPISQTFEFVATPDGPKKSSRTVTVRCQAAYFLFGDWHCVAN